MPSDESRPCVIGPMPIGSCCTWKYFEDDNYSSGSCGSGSSRLSLRERPFPSNNSTESSKILSKTGVQPQISLILMPVCCMLGSLVITIFLHLLEQNKRVGDTK